MTDYSMKKILAYCCMMPETKNQDYDKDKQPAGVASEQLPKSVRQVKFASNNHIVKQL